MSILGASFPATASRRRSSTRRTWTRSARRCRADLFYCETIVNPTTTVPDLAALAELCREAGVLSAVDNTFASPYLCNPVALGFDVALHSATKYVGARRPDRRGRVHERGAVPAAPRHRDRPGRLDAAARGVAVPPRAGDPEPADGAPLRLRGEAGRGAGGASAVERVHYPGLPDHPQHEIAARQLRDFGGTLAFEVAGGLEAGSRVAEALELGWIGGPRQRDDAGRAPRLHDAPPGGSRGRREAGIGDGLLRVAVGLEDPTTSSTTSCAPSTRHEASARRGPVRRRSAEHEISCISARSVIDALDPDRNEVVPIGITREGRWHRLAGRRRCRPRPADAAGDRRQRGGGGARERGRLEELVADDGSREPIDVVFPVLHGPFGEDGTVQGLLELAGVPYVGAGVLGSAIGMDKDVQKRLFREAGLPVGRVRAGARDRRRDDPDAVDAAARPSATPCSRSPRPWVVGRRAKVAEPEQLAAALDEAFRYARLALVERAFEGAREIECAVLGNDEPVASVAGEIVPEDHEFYDYDAKYLDEHGAQLSIPADLEPEVLEEVQRLAVAAFRAIRCAGMARVDFFLEGEDVLWVNEPTRSPGSRRSRCIRSSGRRRGCPTRTWSSACSTSPSSGTRPSARARVFASWAAEQRSPTLQVDDGAGEGARDALDRLDPRHDQSPEVVDAVGLGADDHVVRTRHVLGLEHPLGPARSWRPRPPSPLPSGSGCTREPRCASSRPEGAHAIGAWAARPTRMR